MSSGGERKGRKRSKAFYRKSAYGAKRQRAGSNVLEAGIRGFLVMCNSNEGSAVKESYNILNEYADRLYGQEKPSSADSASSKDHPELSSEEDSECDDVEKALKKEVDGIKSTTPTQRRFQNVSTKAKNCVFIRTTVEDPVKLVLSIMEDIAQQGLRKARYAARILPIIGTCKAHTKDIEELAKDLLKPLFSADNADCPSSYTVLFKARNNNGSTCGKTSVIPALTSVIAEINSAVKFSWSDFQVAVLVEVVCTVCCLGVAPSYVRLRKYNLQELQQGPKTTGEKMKDEGKPRNSTNEVAETSTQEAILDKIDKSSAAACKAEEKTAKDIHDGLDTDELQVCSVESENNDSNSALIVVSAPHAVMEEDIDTSLSSKNIETPGAIDCAEGKKCEEKSVLQDSRESEEPRKDDGVENESKTEDLCVQQTEVT